MGTVEELRGLADELLFKKVLLLEKELNRLKEELPKLKEEIRNELPNLDNVLKSVKGKDSHPEEVAPLIINPVSDILKNDDEFQDLARGHQGDSYILTEEDKKEIAKSIKVPIVEKVIEKTEVIVEKPIVTEITKVTNEIKEVAKSDTPEQIRDKLEELEGENRLDKKAIRGLEEELEKLKKGDSGVRFIGGGRRLQPVRFSFTGDASTTSFTLETTPYDELLVWAHAQGQWLQPGVHFTIAGKTLTTTYTPANGEIIEGVFLKF